MANIYQKTITVKQFGTGILIKIIGDISFYKFEQNKTSAVLSRKRNYGKTYYRADWRIT